MIDSKTANDDLWGVVLAGGEGKRLENYVRQLWGECVPKQYVSFIGTRSMLQHTLNRAERLIPRRHILTIITERHLLSAEVRRQLSNRTPGTVIAQPENKGTGLGMLLPLTYLYKCCPDAIVVVFPSDHFILEEERFMDHVRLAFHAARYDPKRIVLLAMEAQSAETEYGYIVSSGHNGKAEWRGCRRVACFVEKPALDEARLLVAAGALWNTMIMAFKVKTFLCYVTKLFPDIARRFRGLARTIGTAAEKEALRRLYRTRPPLDLSRDILETISTHIPGAITVLPVLQVTWSDWGSPRRLAETRRIIERRMDAANGSQQLRDATRRAAKPGQAVSVIAHGQGSFG